MISGLNDTIDAASGRNIAYSGTGSTISSVANAITINGDDSTATIIGSGNTLVFSETNDTLTIDQTNLASGVSQEVDTYVGGGGSDQESSSLFNLINGGSESDTYHFSSMVSDNYTDYSGANETGSVTQQDQINTDGSREETFFDPSTGVANETDNFDANGNETTAEFNYSSGTSEVDVYNPQSGVSDQYTAYSGENETGAITQEGQYNTNGSYQFTFIDPSSGVSSETNYYNASGTETSAEFDFSSGTSEVDNYNPQSGVSDQYTDYSGANQTGYVLEQGQENTDGSTGAEFYNAGGNETSADFNLSNGTSQQDLYDPQPGITQQYTNYSGVNETGSITQEGQYSTNGSYQFTFIDPSSGVSSETNYFSASGAETSAEFNYSSGKSELDNYNPQSGVSDQYTGYNGANDAGVVTQSGMDYTDGTSEITYYNPGGRVSTDAVDYSSDGDKTYADETFDSGRQEDITYDYNKNGVYTGEDVGYYSARGTYEGYEDYNRNGEGEAGNYGAGYGVGYSGGGGGYDGGGGGGYYGGYDFTKGASALVSKGTNIGSIAKFDLAIGQAGAAGAAENALDQAQASAQAKQAPAFEGAKWESQVPSTRPTITWSFATNPGSAADPFSGYLDAQYQATVEKAVQAWASASGLTFVEVPDSAASDLRIGWGAFDTQSSGVLGYTSYNQSNGAIQPGAIIRLEDPTQDALTAGSNGQLMYSGPQASLYQVVLHEIGHALGLADNADPNSVMYASASSSNQTLDETDIAGVRQLYEQKGNGAVGSTIAATALGGLDWGKPSTTSSEAAGVHQLVQAMASFKPAKSASSSTVVVAQNATPTLATPRHH